MNSMLVGYLGRVARIGCPEEGNIERLECAVALLVDESELPRTVAEAVNRYVNDPSAAGSLVVASSIVHAGLWEVGVDGIVQRLAVAYKDGELTAAATAELLSLIPPSERQRLSVPARTLVETADLVIEDDREGWNRADSDDTFRDAVDAFLHQSVTR